MNVCNILASQSYFRSNLKFFGILLLSIGSLHGLPSSNKIDFNGNGNASDKLKSKELAFSHRNFSLAKNELNSSKLINNKLITVQMGQQFKYFDQLRNQDVISNDKVYYISAIVVSLFSFLTFVVVIQFLGVKISRGLTDSTTASNGVESSYFNWINFIPNEFIKLTPELMAKISDLINKPNPEENDDALILKRTKRSTKHKRRRQQLSFKKWWRAYQEDPVSYSCIRKLICETLANSKVAELSVKSELGETIMLTLGRIFEHGNEVIDIISDVVGDPNKCIYYAPDQLCT